MGETLGDSSIEKQYGNWEAPDTSNGGDVPTGHEVPDNGEGEGRKFGMNQLIVGDSNIKRIRDLLEENKVRVKFDKHRDSVTGESGITIPGEYVVTITDPEEMKPASPEYVDKVVSLLKSQEIAVRYGNKDGNGA